MRNTQRIIKIKQKSTFENQNSMINKIWERTEKQKKIKDLIFLDLHQSHGNFWFPTLLNWASFINGDLTHHLQSDGYIKSSNIGLDVKEKIH